MYIIDIDVLTAIKIIAVSNITVAALILLNRYEEGTSKSVLKLFAYAHCTIAIGMALISLRGTIAILLSAHLANVLVYVGVALEMYAFSCISRSHSLFNKAFFAIPFTGAALFLAVDYLSPPSAGFGSRYVVISSFVVGSLYGFGGMNLIHANGSSQIRKVLGSVFVILALCFFGRAYMSAGHGISMFQQSVIQTLTFLTWLIATIVCGLGFILVMNEDANRDLRLAAITDPLTTLANRRRFNEVLAIEFSRLKRSAFPLSLILLDVDHFKRFNDRYGHVQGDVCLKQVSQAIKAAVNRASDVAARFGGEEFAVVAPETDTAGAVILAEKIRQAVESLAIPHEGNTAAPCVTISLGVVTRYTTELESPEAFVSLADQSLYRAKERGRNRTEITPRESSGIIEGVGLARLIWTDLATSGNAQLDEEHKALFCLSNSLLSAALEEKPKQEIQALLDRILEDIVGHFRDEEAILAHTAYPYTAQHIVCHKGLVAKAREMLKRFDQNDLSIGDLFLFLAHDVVAHHICHEDRKFFPYLVH